EARNLELGLLDARKYVETALVVGEPSLRRTDASGRAVEQSGAKNLLQLHHRFADRGPGDAQRTASLGIAAKRHDFGEGVHGLQLIHGQLYLYWMQFGENIAN